MQQSTDDLITHDVRDAQVFGIPMPGGHELTYAIDSTGQILVNGDLHPRGNSQCIAEAMQDGIEWAAVGAVQAFFPITWMLAKCEGVSPERVIVLANLERFIRSRG